MAPGAANYDHARSAFDYFSSEEGATVAFMENAGGSQIPRCVANAVSEFYSQHYAQLGAGYGRSQRATQIVNDAHAWLEVFMNCAEQGKVIIGPSTSQLAFNLASAFSDVLGPSDSILLQEASHEAVVGPWVRLAQRRGCRLAWWRAQPGSGASPLEQLEQALSPATRIVVLTHVSNLLGEVLDLAEAVRRVRGRAAAAQVVVDGVAFSPHRAMDVSGWGVDWYLWSAYKVYGPHVAVMYGRHAAHEALLAQGGAGPNHYFVDPRDMSYKFELGGPSHEGCAGLLALQDYLLHLLGGPHQQEEKQPQLQQQDGGQEEQGREGQRQGQQQATHDPQPSDVSSPSTPSAPPSSSKLLQGVRLRRSQVEAAFALMTALEAPLQRRLLSYLAGHPAVRLVGPADADPAGRVPTISFVHRRKSSTRVARELQAAGFAVRAGHMYARRLVEALAAEGGLLAAEAAVRQQNRDGTDAEAGAGSGGASGAGGSGGSAAAAGGFDVQLAVEDGVVRVSLLHYNTPAEVEALVQALGRVL